MLKPEPLGLLFALVASFLWIVSSLYSIGYMRKHQEKNQTRFYACFSLAIAATMGIAFAGNMLTLFVFYEGLTLFTYPLVTHAGDEKAKRAGRIYLGLLLSTSVLFLLPAIIWTWHLTGSLEFTKGGILAGTTSEYQLGILFVLYVFGCGKAALMPFHRWLPSAMVAPAPVSALLHAVAVVKAGVFTILKVTIYLFGTDLVTRLPSINGLIAVAAVTILFASLVAMTKDNLKARLAYSTISQLGYVVLGALLASKSSIIGSSIHIVNHAFGKITLFFCAGAIMLATQKTHISQMQGIGHTMPFTMLAFLIASLSIIGLPPFGGLWSKYYLLIGTLEADQLALLVVLMISSLLNIIYLLQIPIRAFFLVPKTATESIKIHEAPTICLVAMAITALICVGLFFYPQRLIQFTTLLTGSVL